MALNNKQNLLQKAGTIFDEKKEGANTAARIGQMFKDIINETDKSLSDNDTAHSTLQTNITSAQNVANTAKTTADAAKTAANEAKNAVATLQNSKGAANGIAPLGPDRKVPAANLPEWTDDVLEFAGVKDSVTVELSSSIKSSTDPDAKVIYNNATHRFVLAVRNANVSDSDWNLIKRGDWDDLILPHAVSASVQPQVALAPSSVSLNGGISQNGLILTDKTYNNGLALDVSSMVTYYGNWIDAALYGTQSGNGVIPHAGKLYVCVGTNRSYYWNGSMLVTMGADDEALKNLVSNIHIYPFSLQVYHANEAEKYPAGTIVYSVADLCFYKVTEDESGNKGTAYADEPYNMEVEYQKRANTSYLYRCDGRLYVVDLETYRLWPLTDYKYVSDAIESQQSFIQPRMFLNANRYLYNNTPMTLAQILAAIDGKDEQGIYFVGGIVVTFIGTDGWEAWQWLERNYLDHNTANRQEYINPANWKKFGGGSSVGNCYNVTNEQPISGYYDLESAVNATFNKKYASVGMQITFAIAKGSWKTYQYVGSDITDTSFKNLSNWVDNAALSAGAETLININELCGALSSGAPYTLDTALSKLSDYETEKGIKYAKEGLVITYRVGDNKWETKQFHGILSDFYTGSTTLWKDFGGGNTQQVEVTDTPKSKSKQALSAGGAYEHLIADFQEDLDENEGVKTYTPVNADGQQIGQTAIVVPLAGSGGSSSGKSFNIIPKDAALYGAYGSSLIGHFSIRSVTLDGDAVTSNLIKTIKVIDTTTGIVLETRNVNQASSGSATVYTFEIDFTSYLTSPSSKEFTIEATDDEGSQKRKNYTVIAVDATVTVDKVQSLHYVADQVLEVGGSTKSIRLYKFDKNVSDDGIRAYIDLYYNGEWKRLGTAVVEDQFTHTVPINPCDIFGNGEMMTHGSYPIRIQGQDIASGVKGNTVYTSVMCVDPNSTAPIVSLRYDDKNNGSVRLYDTVEIEVAAYTPGANQTSVNVLANGELMTALNAYSNTTTRVSKQIQGFTTDGSQSIAFKAVAGTSQSQTITLKVLGSAIGVVIKDGAAFGYDFASRSNDETDHAITNNGMTMAVNGCNWSSNGFSTYLGETALRIAENVTANIPFAPFPANVENSGMAIQFAFATNNIKDADAKLMECYDPASGAGFYVRGNKVAIFCAKGQPKQLEERSFKCGEKITMAVVVEPSHLAYDRNGTSYATMKMYLNGEEVACIGYVPNTGSITSDRTIKFNGADGDFYLYYMLAYNSHYEWVQAFQNYLVKLTNTDAMKEEYESEQVLDSKNTPSLDSLKAKGIPYYVVVNDAETFKTFDGDTNTSTKFSCTLFYYNPQYPCLNFKCTNVQWRRQGTTSAKRPVKNDRFYLNKPVNKSNKPVMTLLNPDDSTELGRKAIELAKKNYTMIAPYGIPVQIITVKVDYSDSSNANDCGVCDMMNATFRALGSNFMTPAQRAYDGTFTKGDLTLSGFQMDHSTKNHPIAAFRATSESLADAYFHAKGNWKEDKGEQVALGFKDTPGYNKGCLNYGDFYEFFGTENETLDQIETRFKAEWTADQSKEAPSMKSDKPYILSLYCGRNYRVMRYNNGSWVKSTGSMKQVAGKWVISGDVLNPVSGYELLSYEGMDWFQGVSSIEDMMTMTTDISSWVTKLGLSQAPAWCKYFECMIDDDNLQMDLALGKKVPYELYRLLRFCDECDYSKVAETVWKPKWKTEAWKYMSVESVFAYTLFTDYLAAGDQRAKNMQPMFFLEDGYSVTDGVYSADEAVRMYLNKVYDCDTCNGKDNDGGCTFDPETDPNKPTAEDGSYTNPYAGWGSILFTDINSQPEMYRNGNQTADNLLELSKVCKQMRECRTTLPDGRVICPFAPGDAESREGAYYYFIEQRLKFWPKLVSSYDGERKYIKFTSTSDSLYFYALQGLGLTALPSFIETRWRIRDGYYCVGQFFTGVLSGRIACSKANAVIRIKAAKTGYFGIGNDASGNHSEVVFLEAGQRHTFTNFSHETGALLYIYQADRMSEIDLSELSLDNTFDFSVMKLAEKIVLGGSGHVNINIGSYSPLTGLDLKDLPFLKHLDISYTLIQALNASKCPRLETMLGQGSKLTSCSLAETSPVSSLKLPRTMTELVFVNLPNLSYPGNMSFDGLDNVTKLMVSGCPKIDATKLFTDAYNAGSTITQIRLTNLAVTASATILQNLMNNKAVGLDQNGNPYDEKNLNRCSGLSGQWVLNELLSQNEWKALDDYFFGLTVYNSQFTTCVFDDTINDPKNITNLSNNTTGASYKATDHLLRIRENLIPVVGKWDDQQSKWVGQRLSDSNYRMLKDGSEWDYTDALGSNVDAMMRCPRFWYKGINDFKNQDKYICWSSNTAEPLSTATEIARANVFNILLFTNRSIDTTKAVIGKSTLDTASLLIDTPNYNIGHIDVEGMRQVRWPGVNSATNGALFLDENGVIIGTFNMAIGASDFLVGEDYLFCDVPAGAKTFVFCSPAILADTNKEVIAVNSDNVEAIEPDWVLNDPWLCGIYEGSVDSMLNYRSISGASVRTGTGTSVTSSEWQYDEDGRPTNTPLNAMNYTYKDIMNLAARRGQGFQLIDYEMSKLMALLWMCLNGTRDVQLVCGYGQGAGGKTGYMDTIGNRDSQRASSNNGNKILGFESFVACTWEVMDNIAVNVKSYESCIKNKFVEIADDPLDVKYHIYDPIKKTERVVQGINSSGYCIGRTRHGRYCDVIASKVTADNSKWTQNYTDCQYYSHSRCRVVGRAYDSANANGGLVFSYAGNASSNSYTNFGSRLAFRGPILITNE